MKKLFLIVCVVVVASIASMAWAGSVTLEWTPNSEPDLAGYRAFVRDWNGAYDYTNPAWEGTATTCTIESLDEAKLPHFVVRAFDAEGLESEDSNEVYLSNGPPGSPGGLLIITPQGS